MYKNLVFDFEKYCFDVECLVKKVTKEDLKIDNTSLTKIENEEIVLSDIKSYTKFSKIALERIMSSDFADDNLIYLMSELSNNISPIAFKTLLVNISDTALDNFTELEYIADTTIKTSMKYLLRTDRITDIEDNIFDILKSLKSYYSSSTVRDPDVVELKNRTKILIESNTTVATSWIITAMNINFILYIVLNGLIKK